MTQLNSEDFQPVYSHHYLRTFFASIFGFIASSLIIAGILVAWLSGTLTNTTQYVQTVAPLVNNVDVQNFVVDATSKAMIDGAPVKDLANQLLDSSQIVGQTEDQLLEQVKPVVQDSLRSVIKSPAFAQIWKDNNQDIHSQLISQLNANTQTITLNFHPLIIDTIDQLSTTKLGGVMGKLDIKNDVGEVTVEGKQLDTFHKAYDYIQKGMVAVIIAAVLSVVLAVVISVHHLKTLRRIALSTGIYCAIMAALLSATSLINIDSIDPLQQKMVIALVSGITQQLRISLIIIAVVCIAAVIASKVYSIIIAKKAEESL